MSHQQSGLRILLTNPPLGRYPLGYTVYTPMIPMGIGFIARALQDHDIPYVVLDNYLASYHDKHWNVDQYIGFLMDYRPTHVCISTLSIQWPEALQLIIATRKSSPGSLILVGGAHTHFAAHMIESYCDYVVIGEGEVTLPDILLGKISGQCDHGKIIQCEQIEPLDALIQSAGVRKRMIPWHDFNPTKYKLRMPEWGLERTPVVNLNTSRGCPYDCRFCSVLGPWGHNYRCFSADLIVNEIEFLVSEFAVNGICFREDNFTAMPSRVRQICNLLIERGLNIDWAAETRVDFINEYTADLMKNSGCTGLLFGVESGSQKMLSSMNKSITVDQIRRAFRICKQFGIKTFASIVYGLPGENDEDRLATKNLISDLDPHFFEESIYLGMPGSSYYSELLESANYEYFDPMTLHLFPRGYKSLYEEIIGNSGGVLPY